MLTNLISLILKQALQMVWPSFPGEWGASMEPPSILVGLWLLWPTQYGGKGHFNFWNWIIKGNVVSPGNSDPRCEKFFNCSGATMWCRHWAIWNGHRRHPDHSPIQVIQTQAQTCEGRSLQLILSSSCWCPTVFECSHLSCRDKRSEVIGQRRAILAVLYSKFLTHQNP